MSKASGLVRSDRERSIFGRLWLGELALAEAFWTWAVLGGALVNLITSLLFYALIIHDRPVLALLAGYGPSLPYNLVVLVGVWRSADRHAGLDTRSHRIDLSTDEDHVLAGANGTVDHDLDICRLHQCIGNLEPFGDT